MWRVHTFPAVLQRPLRALECDLGALAVGRDGLDPERLPVLRPLRLDRPFLAAADRLLVELAVHDDLVGRKVRPRLLGRLDPDAAPVLTDGEDRPLHARRDAVAVGEVDVPDPGEVEGRPSSLPSPEAARAASAGASAARPARAGRRRRARPRRRRARRGASCPTPGARRAEHPPQELAGVDARTWATSSGVPSATMRPPASPPSGPRSITRSAVRITSRLCSMTTTVFPFSVSEPQDAEQFAGCRRSAGPWSARRAGRACGRSSAARARGRA